MTINLLTSATTLERSTWLWQGYRIQYTVHGEGLPLVLLHGFGASIGHWRKNIPVLAAAGYRVYALDLLGFGASDKPALAYSIDLWAQLVHDFWTEQIGSAVVWIGNSIGALLSLTLTAQFPQITKGAVLLNCAGGLNHRPDELSPPLRLVMGLFTRLIASPTIGGFLFNLVRQKSRIRSTLHQVYRNSEAITDELVDMLYAPSCDPGAQQVFASILTAPPGTPPRELLPHVQAPLLVLWGEADPWTPISGATPFQEHTASPVQIVPIPDTGHCPHDERPDVVNALIIDWLASLSV
ncbi:MAG: alpha/beta fold hydrolase [Cyanobacteria bacterium]|nr:alpha/beta fold hydrolase [Cyanobacteriota bacterium]